MEDSVIIGALKDASKPNHKIPLKPIDDVNRKLDALTLEVKSLKREIMIMQTAQTAEKPQNTQTGWFW